MKTLAAIIAFLLGTAMVGMAEHPQVLVTSADREVVRQKIATQPWANTAYANLKARVDACLAETRRDPGWLASRLFMHWQTHYTTAVVEHSRWVGGEGRAPIPTPRFGGARDWAAHYALPAELADWKPYNEDASGRIWLINLDTGKAEWTDAGDSGRIIESANSRVMQLAADAAFIYWLTGDEDYARLADNVFRTYLDGFAHVTPPRIADHDRSLAGIIGMTSFEVIHEEIMPPLGLTYDFLHPYLVKQGRDPRFYQTQLKRLCDRVIAGGGAHGNWNLNQANLIAYPALALDDDTGFTDGHGRQYYVNVLLNADLPRQRGLLRAIKEDYDPDTALWPEAPGYGFGTTPQIILIASLLGNDPQGRTILNNPLLPRAILAQLELLYPDGWSIGLGDTDQTRVNSPALELMIAYARQTGDHDLENRLTAALQREIDSGQYRRDQQTGLLALTRYVPELRPAPPKPAGVARTFFGKPLNVVMQRNLAADPAHSLCAAMYGTDGGHVHANGLAMELYGAGFTLGADPGRGASYWQKDHGEYYSQPPAHNTVIVNGDSTYPAYGAGHLAMKVDLAEPAFGHAGVSPNISFVQSSFAYAHPDARQQRTLALVRVGGHCGFYWDVFRSRAIHAGGSFQDYIYHNVGQSLVLASVDGGALPLTSSADLTGPGWLPGYQYFKQEKSALWTNGLHATFTLDLPAGPASTMNLWMPGAPGRKVYSLAAPADHAARESMPAIARSPMPTLLVRQDGEAWKRPFLAVYEPARPSEGAFITNVYAGTVSGGKGTLAAVVVEGKHFHACLLQDEQAATTQTVENYQFRGHVGVVILRDGQTSELYLGAGQRIDTGSISLVSTASKTADADLCQSPAGWICSASAPVTVTVTWPVPSTFMADKTGWNALAQTGKSAPATVPIRWHLVTATSGETIISATCQLPAGINQTISFEKSK